MKTLKPINFALSLTLGFFISAISIQAIGQEYDDMYFTKSDRKTVKVEAKKSEASEVSAPTYKEAVATTENVSSKNINPEYIARYKETESNDASAYNDQDYFVEDYNKDSLITRQIDYAALNKRDQMSQSNQNRYYSYPSWGFSPYMSMGYGMGYGMPYGYGYDPFMMGYGPSYSMGFGFGSGFYPSMSMSMSMSWGTGYNPWGGWGAYPYRPYGMYGYDPFAYGAGYSSYYGGRYYSPYSGFGMYSMYNFYGNSRPIYVINGSEQNLNYKPRTNRSYADSKISRSNTTENSRVSTTTSRVRVPENVSNSPTDNNRVTSRDYSRTQNEYYNDARRNASSTSRITSAESTRSNYLRNSSAQSSSTINENRPSRSTGFSNYSGQSTSGTRSNSSYSSIGNNRSSSSYSTPSRGTSSGFNNSGFSSGSGSRSSSGYSSGSSSSGSRSSSPSSSGSSSGRGGRQ